MQIYFLKFKSKGTVKRTTSLNTSYDRRGCEYVK